MVLLPLMLALASLDGSSLGSAAQPALESYNGAVINSIGISIDGRVSPAAVRRSLRLAEGDLFDAAAWNNDLQKLINMGFIRGITTQAAWVAPGEVALRISVDEAWSLLPILGYQRGVVDIIIAGAYDADLAGELIELGAFYMRRDRYNLVRAWLILPNVLAYGVKLELQMAMTGATLGLYPGDPYGVAAARFPDYTPASYRWRMPETGTEIIRRGGFADLGYEFIPDLLEVSARLLLFDEAIYDLPNYLDLIDRMNQDQRQPDLQRQRNRRGLLSIATVNAIVGRVDMIDGYRFSGHEGQLVAALASRLIGSYQDFGWLYLTYRGFLLLGTRFEIGWRAAVASASSHDPAYGFTLGGDNLDPFFYRSMFPGVLTVRGLRETHLHGQSIAFANLEVRGLIYDAIPLWFASPGVLQAAAFVDSGAAWDGHPFSRTQNAYGSLSAGAGLLATLPAFRYTYLNWYYAHAFWPLSEDRVDIVMTRPFF